MTRSIAFLILAAYTIGMASDGGLLVQVLRAFAGFLIGWRLAELDPK